MDATINISATSPIQGTANRTMTKKIKTNVNQKDFILFHIDEKMGANKEN